VPPLPFGHLKDVITSDGVPFGAAAVPTARHRAKRVGPDRPGYASRVDLAFLTDLTRTSGPYATVYLDVSHDAEDAARALELRWAGHRGELAEQGADEATLAALDAAVADADPAVGRAGRVLVAAGGRVLLDRVVPEPPARPSASWGPAADLLPLLLDAPEPLTAVVARVDKTGGEILLAGEGGDPERVDEVRGDEYPLHKTRGGGWKHLKMQHTVENTWRSNVAALAERVDAEVRRTGARVLVVAGDGQSRTLLRDALPERSAGIAVDVDHSGGRSGADDEELATAVAAAVRDVVDAERHAVLDRLDQERNRPDGLAAVGLEPVLQALRAEQVDTLLLDGEVPRDGELWVGASPSQVATDEERLRGLGSEPVGRLPVDAALLQAAAASGAVFQPLGGGRTGLVGKPVEDGVAALLRYPLVTHQGP
jgi:Bacterial archaeo-eukaryotic release factor family 2